MMRRTSGWIAGAGFFTLLVGCAFTSKPKPKPEPQPRTPVSELEQLRFANPSLARRTRVFHDMAERLAGDGWRSSERYEDTINEFAPHYVAWWKLYDYRRNNTRRQFVARQELSITLEGPPAEENAAEQITSATILGQWAPESGCAAWVLLRLDSQTPEAFTGGRVGVVLDCPKGENSFSSPLLRNEGFQLVGGEFSVKLNEYNQHPKRTYRYSVTPKLSQEASMRRLLGLYESPENLRHIAIADLRQVRRLARKQLPEQVNVECIEWVSMRSSIPPHAKHIDEFPERARRRLMEDLETQLDAREQLIHENYREIYQAMKKAMPLDEALQVQ